MTYFPPHVDALAAYAPGEQPTDPAVIKLNTNENPYPPSPRVLQALRAVDPERLRRYPDPLAEQFRAAAAQLFHLTPDNILCGNGADDLLNIIIRALTSPHHGLAYPVPTYTLCAVLAHIHGCPVREIPFRPDFALPAEQLLAARANLTYVCNPNSPTATFIPPPQLADLARRLTGVLLVDEAYADFADTNCLDLARSLPNVLLVRSLSKGYCLAGLRFGYALGHPDLIAGLMKVKDSYNVDALAIAAATAAIQDQPYFRDAVQRVRAERDRLAAALRQLNLSPLPSQANFLFARCQSPPARLVYQTLKARNILVRHFDQPGLADWLRITIGTPQQNDALLRELQRIITAPQTA
jgi:histidinol-phosphate aminotransferase